MEIHLVSSSQQMEDSSLSIESVTEEGTRDIIKDTQHDNI